MQLLAEVERKQEVDPSLFFGMSGSEFDGIDFDDVADDEQYESGGESEGRDEDSGNSRRLRQMKEGEFRKSELDLELDGGYRLPYELNENLFEYQRTGVRWLWELYSQHTGGIIGDEMVSLSQFLGPLSHFFHTSLCVCVLGPGQDHSDCFVPCWPSL